jgi:glycosyltransferase involved in cell wall biosynthesis
LLYSPDTCTLRMYYFVCKPRNQVSATRRVPFRATPLRKLRMLKGELTDSGRAPTTILAVIVLYKLLPSESVAVATLQASMANLRSGGDAIRVLLYDNTPGKRDPGPLPDRVEYDSAGHNAGLAVAYNRALDVAQLHGCSWILLLDQDTALPCDFLGLLLEQIEQSEGDSSVAALVPMVRSGDTVVSPKRVGFFGLKALPESCHGIQNAEVMSINSGSAIRCDFVRSVGGFNRSFWLDYLDHWLFRQVYATGRKVAIWKCTIEHSLSVQDYRRNIRIERYRSILAGESTFITTYKPKVHIPFYLLRLLVRSVRLMSQGQSRLARLTFATIVKIAFHPTRSLEDSCSEPDIYQN